VNVFNIACIPHRGIWRRPAVTLPLPRPHHPPPMLETRRDVTDDVCTSALSCDQFSVGQCYHGDTIAASNCASRRTGLRCRLKWRKWEIATSLKLLLNLVHCDLASYRPTNTDACDTGRKARDILLHLLLTCESSPDNVSEQAVSRLHGVLRFPQNLHLILILKNELRI